MGRPPLNLRFTGVRLPVGDAERIDALVGKHGRAEFIREAVRRELLRRETDAKNQASDPQAEGDEVPTQDIGGADPEPK